jgi:hypothetical protein
MRARVGIVQRLLAASLLGVIVAVAVVQAWTLHLVSQSGMQEAQARLDTGLAILKEELRQHGSDWRLDSPGSRSLPSARSDG